MGPDTKAVTFKNINRENAKQYVCFVGGLNRGSRAEAGLLPFSNDLTRGPLCRQRRCFAAANY